MGRKRSFAAFLSTMAHEKPPVAPQDLWGHGFGQCCRQLAALDKAQDRREIHIHREDDKAFVQILQGQVHSWRQVWLCLTEPYLVYCTVEHGWRVTMI